MPWIRPSRFLRRLDAVWVISDTHWGHRRLREVLAPGIRPADVDSRMIVNWSKVVGEWDVVLHLGDVFMEEITFENVSERFPRLPGQTVLLPGNHDSEKKMAALAGIGWLMVQPFAVGYQGWTVHFSHQPIEDLPKGELNVHGHIHALPSPSRRHFNASVERIGYQPIPLKRVLDDLVAANGGPQVWGGTCQRSHRQAVHPVGS